MKTAATKYFSKDLFNLMSKSVHEILGALQCHLASKLKHDQPRSNACHIVIYTLCMCMYCYMHMHMDSLRGFGCLEETQTQLTLVTVSSLFSPAGMFSWNAFLASFVASTSTCTRTTHALNCYPITFMRFPFMTSPLASPCVSASRQVQRTGWRATCGGRAVVFLPS